MKVIIVGAGEVGKYLAEVLSQRDQDVTVLERDAELASELEQELDIRVLRQSGSSADALVRAGVESSDFFLAMTSDDETNLIASSLAKALGANQTFARIHDQTFRDASLINYQRHFGIDHLLNPERLAAVEMAKSIRNPGRVAVEDFGRGMIEVQAISIHKRAKVLGRPLAELKLSGKMRVGLVQRGSETIVANAGTVLEVGDTVTLFGAPEAIYEVLPLFDPVAERRQNVNVVILGGGEIGVSLVQLLSHTRFNLRIIEQSRAVCERLADAYPKINVIHGEGTSLRLLEEEQIGQADFFVACTRDDEDNIMTCLQASKLGTPHTLLSISRPDYIEILERLGGTLGIERAVSPRIATAQEVLRYVGKKSFTELVRLPEDSGVIVEIRVGKDSPCVNKKLREVKWPKECLVVGLEHRYEVRTPGAEDTIRAGDWLLVLVKPGLLDELVALTTR
ncbi:MAG: Trk system potassium transporter TrkA [Puniceicoccaceae bacterium]|nr:MAG: Trk system potassium transporter TrkA [Puniceicoccaceae bacterium]